MATRVELLSQIPLFALMEERELAALAERLDEVERPEGTPLFHAGDPGDAAYVVLEGEVEIFFKNATGERTVLETIRPGGFFGEISLLDSGPRTASALGCTALRLLVIDHDDLEQFLIARPQASLHLLAAMGRRLRESNRLLRGSASRNVNIEHEDKRSMVQKGADWISDFSGSLPFLFIHVGIFTFWIVMNIEPLATLLMGWIVLDQMLSAGQVVGGVIVVTGIVLLTYRKTDRPHAKLTPGAKPQSL